MVNVSTTSEFRPLMVMDIYWRGIPLLSIPPIIFFNSAIAAPGFKPYNGHNKTFVYIIALLVWCSLSRVFSLNTFGHVFVQFMMVWHLYTDHLSRNISIRSAEHSSRESIIHLKKWWLNIKLKWLKIYFMGEGGGGGGGGEYKPISIINIPKLISFTL